MARQLLCNGLPIPQQVAIRVGKPVVLKLSLSDADVTSGGTWTLAPTGGGITFNPLTADVPATATSPVELIFNAEGGFTEPGSHRVLVQKIAGPGASATVPVWTVNFRVSPAAVARRSRQPAVTADTQTAVPHDPDPAVASPTQVQNGGRSTGMSGGFIFLSIVALAMSLYAFNVVVHETLAFADAAAKIGLQPKNDPPP